MAKTMRRLLAPNLAALIVKIRPKEPRRFPPFAGSMSVIDSMTMSAPEVRVKLVVPKPTNRLGRKEPNDDYYRSRFPSRVSTNCFGRY